MQLPATERQCVRFGPFAVDLVSHELRSNGRKINLQEKPFQLLAILLEHPGRLVTREELRDRLWPADTFVDFEHSINTAIKKVREALEESGDHHSRFIETLPRRGYRFIAPAEVSGEDCAALRLVSAGLNNAFTEAPQRVETRHKGQSLWRAVPDQRTLAWGSVPILVVLAIVAASIWYRHAQSNAPAVATIASIAVLPFADLSPGHDQEYFSEGLAEEILDHLTKIPNLKVTARASAFQFKGKNKDSRVVGQKLDVADILEGSVQREKNRVRVTARLIKADDGYDLWSESFDRDLKDIFAVEDDIAKAVASALQLKLLAGRSPTTLTTSGTTNPETYEAFLHARYFAHMQDEESARKALLYANKAIQSDPNYAPAYALRAGIELESGGMVFVDYSEAIEKTRHDTEKAIALDPNLADGYRVLSMIQSWVESNCREAETSLKRAIDLAPGDPDNLGLSAWLAMCQGRPEEAVELWKQELLLDPLRPDEYLFLAQSLRDLGRYEEARGALAKALDLNPNQVSMIHEVGGEVYLAQGRPQEALAEMEKEPAGLYRDLGEALAYHALGRRQESDAPLARIISQHTNDGAYQIGQVYAYRGETDRAFEWLNRAYIQHDPGLGWFKTDLKLKSLRKDPRYALLLKKLNLPE
ncbi:MAG: winged helix-turn-helix domain-containing protein [Acidobacteriia bacterium]|nr:winged helix-turn-helix domain-containing protein [Terriglobia bacterium]